MRMNKPDNHSVRFSVISSIIWKMLGNGGVSSIHFFLQLILARLLTPSDFGYIALVVVFINIAELLIQSGLNTALIQKKEIDQVDYSSVFYISLLLALVSYVCIYSLAPFFGRFFDNAGLVLIFRVLSLVFFPGALNSIQRAFVYRSMKFKQLFYCSLAATAISGGIGVILALLGYGIWALVVQYLINSMTLTIILWFVVKWRPVLKFSIERVKILFSFGWKFLVSILISQVYRQIQSLVIGKVFSPTQLGYYHRGQQFPDVIIKNLDGAIQSVMLPALAAQQDYTERVKSMMRRSIVTSSFIVFPIMIGLAVISKPMVILLLTEKWLPAVPVLQILCLNYAIVPIHTANLQAINAMGRSDIYLKLQILKVSIGVIILVIFVRFGVIAIAISQVIYGIISSFVNAYPNKKLLNYGYGEQIKDILPSLLLSLVMGVIVYLVLYLGLTPLITMLIQILVGVVIYVGLAFIFKLECFTYLVQTVLSLLKTKRNAQTK